MPPSSDGIPHLIIDEARGTWASPSPPPPPRPTRTRRRCPGSRPDHRRSSGQPSYVDPHWWAAGLRPGVHGDGLAGNGVVVVQLVDLLAGGEDDALHGHLVALHQFSSISTSSPSTPDRVEGILGVGEDDLHVLAVRGTGLVRDQRFHPRRWICRALAPRLFMISLARSSEIQSAPGSPISR
jgi:hypothetical protein